MLKYEKVELYNMYFTTFLFSSFVFFIDGKIEVDLYM